MTEQDLKKKIETKIDNYIDVHIEEVQESMGEIISRMNTIISSVGFINYLLILKNKIYDEIIKNN